MTIWYRPTCVCASAEPVIRPASTMPAMSCFIVTAVFASENTRGDLSAKVRARTSSSAIARSRGPAAWSNFVGSSDEVGLAGSSVSITLALILSFGTSSPAVR